MYSLLLVITDPKLGPQYFITMKILLNMEYFYLEVLLYNKIEIMQK